MWPTLAGVALGGVIAGLFSWLQIHEQRRGERTRWLREQRLVRYSGFLRAVDVLIDVLYYRYDLVGVQLEHFPPTSLPELGSARSAVNDRMGELSMISSPGVQSLARQLLWAVGLAESSVMDGGPTLGGGHFDDWSRLDDLREEFIRVCHKELDSPLVGLGEQLDYREWLKRWQSETTK